jgi:hypothetical protein
LEENGELTAVLVMSNDMVLPYDVTTKDDFFYQITCDYTKGEQNSLIKTGIVVGGLEPKSVMSSSKKSEEKQNRVFLKILKNQRPVTKVYIGEKLTAVVESDLDGKALIYLKIHFFVITLKSCTLQTDTKENIHLAKVFISTHTLKNFCLRIGSMFSRKRNFGVWI